MSIRLRRAIAGLAPLVGAAFSAATASAEVPSVATDIAPVHSLVARVMDGLGEPSLVVDPGASPHGYSMRPSEARALSEADAVFWIGSELEPWLEDAIANLAPDAVSVALLDAPTTTVLEFRTGATFAEHAHEEHEEEQDHEQGHDPHAWLDPENGKAWLEVIADEMGRLDPENAAAYAANAEAGHAEIEAVEAEIERLIAPARGMDFIVFHDAYHYFEARFGIQAAGAISLSDASDPSPARVEAVRETVTELGVTCVFSEPQYNQALVRTVTEGTRARSAVIDPLGVGLESGPDFYPQLLRSVAEEMVGCAE
ncbi:zinc ABC transporter substrate-binding protein [Roseitranquillus sediminis]|uniref:zinc ABC transporter substrate-binding protein n=1 Tax=Roseitranquillus sediminis TaxID=2809051 RepID=UPI0029CA4493|nr:zinc ABC transporter substrate-binding protein [Roseitranquillus sediminis]